MFWKYEIRSSLIPRHKKYMRINIKEINYTTQHKQQHKYTNKRKSNLTCWDTDQSARTTNQHCSMSLLGALVSLPTRVDVAHWDYVSLSISNSARYVWRKLKHFSTQSQTIVASSGSPYKLFMRIIKHWLSTRVVKSLILAKIQIWLDCK